MVELTTDHELAEAVSKELGLTIDGKIALAGRIVTIARIGRLYQEQWGARAISDPRYIEPARLHLLLSEIIQANREYQRTTAQWATGPRDYVGRVYESMQIQISDNGEWSRGSQRGRTDYSMGQFMAHLRCALPEYNNSIPTESGIPKIPSEAIGPAVQVLLYDRQLERITDLMARLEYRPGETDAETFVQGLLDIYYIPSTTENVAAFMHLIWMLKRKIFHLPIAEPLFFCLHSTRQHMGKTTFLRKLLSGFEWAYSPSGILTHLLRPNDYKAMIRGRFLLDFQELAVGSINETTGNVAEAVIVALKSVISTDIIGGREMYASIDAVERQTAVLCSSTNKHIWDVINDPSGMRRYWEFNLCPPKEFDPEFYLAANIYFENIADLYRAIDENNPVGYYHPSLETWKPMRKIQEAYARENPFLTFAHHRGWIFCSDGSDGAKPIPVRYLVDKYNQYLEERGDPKWTARHVVWVISANQDLLPQYIDMGGKQREVFFVKGYE